MNFDHQSTAFQKCEMMWKEKGFVYLPALYEFAKTMSLAGSFDDCVIYVCKSFNGSDVSLAAIDKAAKANDLMAKALSQYMYDKHLDQVPYERISADEFKRLRDRLFESPERFMSESLDTSWYPYYSPGKTYGYLPQWVRETTKRSSEIFQEFSNSKRSDTAILVGNGPSLNKIDFDLFLGQDVFVSNYAIKNKTIAKYAKGVAVTNYLVAEQEPYWFLLNPIWKFHPIWLACTLPSTDTSILLNALGGDLFFSEDVTSKIAWHSTVTYFWLQILYAAGYRKVVMTGFDHFYHQHASAKEGDLIKQSTDDQNHFDPNYFKGKNWQAADVSKMEETYLLAKTIYEKDAREIVNATVGGHLEVFRRSELSKEITRPRLYGRIARPSRKPKVAIVTAFWERDIDQTELQWRLINRLGKPSADHIHLYKHSSDLLRNNTLSRVVFADIENNYPQESINPHPAGPNLVFVSAVRMLLDTQYTHFFWLEPDCIPTSKDWLVPFLECLEKFPDEPIIGTGGGTVSPSSPHWKNHFAGCSLYNLKQLSEINWDDFIKNELHVSFDIWLAVHLGYIKLEELNNDDQINTVIYGKDRFNYSVIRKPESLVHGMFEHWRPEKIMSPGQLEDRLSWADFSLYHAVKDQDLIKRLYTRLPKSASTIIINYNNDNYIKEAILSALNQKTDNIKYDVIVVDDGSSDTSATIIRSFGDRIKAVYLEHGATNANFNQQRALKEGLNVADGEIIFLLDGDDIFYDEKVQSMCAIFDDTDVVMGQHVLELIDDAGKLMPNVFKAFPNEAIAHDLYVKQGKVNFYQATSGLAFRRSYLLSQLPLLCVDEHLNTWLDVRLTRLAPYYGIIFNSDVAFGAWRRHAMSDSIRTDNISERIQSHEYWYDQVASKAGLPEIPFKWKRAERESVQTQPRSSLIMGGYTRDNQAHWDETVGIKTLFATRSNGVMIDVGAHEGYALMPFLNADWSIIAFEPDENNRAKLIERISKHKNKDLISLDARCVSDMPRKGVAFYRSEQSTGISGLSAFHESHVEAQLVDVTTLTEYFQNKPMPAIDFLKIDTEGYDLFVLQGYPWERGGPAVIECEFEDSKTVPLGYTFHDLAKYLQVKGYTVYVSEWHPIIRYGIRHDWYGLKRYPCDLASPHAWGNLLAFLDDPGERSIATTLRTCVNVKNPDATAVKNQDAVTRAQTVNVAKTTQHKHRAEIPTALGLRSKIVRWIRMKHMSLAGAVKARSLVLFRLGQVLTWSARAARRHPMASAGFLIIVVALAALPVFPQIWPYRSYLWITASLLSIAGIGLVFATIAQQTLLRLLDVLRAEFAASTRAMRNAGDRRIASLETRISALGQELKDKMRVEINESVADRPNTMSEESRALKSRLDEVTTRLNAMSDENRVLKSQLDEVTTRLKTMSEDNSGRSTQLGELTSKLASIALQVDHNALFQRFNRVLTPEHIQVLSTTWSKRLGIQTTKPMLAYIAHRIRMTEQSAVGRLATQIEDAVLRTLVSSAATGKTLEVLEIGTLFGIGLAMIYEHNHPRYDKVHVTAIDPLIGYYGEKVPDKLLNIPVTKSTFWRNMDILGVPRDDVTLIEALSTSNEAMTAARSKQYDVLIIDGDHSYAGVKADFQNYLDMMHSGGLIIFDDYNSADWPDVKRFVDEEVMGRKDVSLVGAEWRTAVFRVV